MYPFDPTGRPRHARWTERWPGGALPSSAARSSAAPAARQGASYGKVSRGRANFSAGDGSPTPATPASVRAGGGIVGWLSPRSGPSRESQRDATGAATACMRQGANRVIRHPCATRRQLTMRCDADREAGCVVRASRGKDGSASRVLSPRARAAMTNGGITANPARPRLTAEVELPIAGAGVDGRGGDRGAGPQSATLC